MPKSASASVILVLEVCGLATGAHAQQRSTNNAITQAEDAFGFSVGRESLGIYSAGNTRGFSPSAAGNLRIDGLYFSPATDLVSPLVDSTSIKVGLSAQGYPFAAPSGIVDISLRKPQDKAAASLVINGDSFGSAGVELDGSAPLSSTLALAYGATFGRVAFPDGTDNINHSQSLMLRWRPSTNIEILPFWSLYNDYDDEAGVFFIPAGKFLPPLARPNRYEGPEWTGFRFIGTNQGVLSRFTLGPNTVLRIGGFRSVNNAKRSFSNFLDEEQPDGTGERIIIADPPSTNRAISGEVRLTQSVAEGPRLHLIYASVRRRDARREFGGEHVLDAGPGRIGESVMIAEPPFNFGPKSHDRLEQTTYGIAYDGRWKNVGEASFGISRADFHKRTFVPGVSAVDSRSRPWLYNGTLAIELAKGVIAYGGFSRGLEESGVAPFSAANRNQPLPVILTRQKDAGVRVNLGGGLRAVAGVFDLQRPYFGFDSTNVYGQVGTTRSRGAEFSVSGALTKRLNVVAGGYFLDPKVERDADAIGNVGKRPVGLGRHVVSASFNWKQPWMEGLELDARVAHRGRIPATTDNQIIIGARPQMDVGGRYHFKLASHDATFRLQVINVFNRLGYAVAAPGVYSQVSSRYATGFLAIDF
jgi:iron complex outermembrane receptor protein